MTIPKRETRFHARTDADFVRKFERYHDAAHTQPFDLTGWSLRFAVKTDALATTDLVAVENNAIVRTDVHKFKVTIPADAFLNIFSAGQRRISAVYALQADGPAGEEQVWAAGAFDIERGL